MRKTFGRVLPRGSLALLPASLSVALLAVFASSSPASASVAAQRGDAAKAAAVVRAFYDDHFARRMCCFDEDGLRQRRRWLAPTLYDALLREVRKKRPDDEVPYFNGDPFTNSQEYPSSFSVGHASAGGGRANVSVLLVWADAGKTYERRTLRVGLTRQGGVWRIDDIRYPQGPSLRGHLKQSG